MNDPEIIEKLDEIRKELSGIKNYIRDFHCMVVGNIIGIFFGLLLLGVLLKYF